MRIKYLVFLLVISLSGKCFSDNYLYHADDVRAAADYLRAHGEYLRNLGEARLAWARAELTKAQAAAQWQEVKRLTLLVNRMDLELKRLRHDEMEKRTKAKEIELRSEQLKYLTTGKTDETVFRAWGILMTRLLPMDTVIEAMSTKVELLREENFIPNKPSSIAESFPGGNTGQLMTFLKTKNYSLSPWGEAHLCILIAVDKLAQKCVEEIDSIRSYMEDLRNGTLNIWNPPGVKPADKPKPPTPGPVASPSPSPSPHPIDVGFHSSCLKAKGGYKSCREDGYFQEECLLADKGYRACRDFGYNQDECIGAKSGYKACMDDHFNHKNCLTADSGYAACREAGNSPANCIVAKSGYKACRDDGYNHPFCLTADKGYSDCKAEGLNQDFCRGARGSYKFCRQEDGQSPKFCVGIGKGYEQCRKNSYSIRECEKADEGYSDCVAS